MVKLYDENKEELIKILNPNSCIIRKQHMSYWNAELTIDNNEAGSMIQRGMWIECLTPKGYQFFKVRLIDKTNENTIRVTTFHNMYSLVNNYVRDTNIVNKTRKEAIEQILNNTLRPNNIIVEANTGVYRNNLRIVGLDPFNAIVGSQDNSVITRYGGEWDFDNNTIIVEDIIGTDRGYLVTWDKNMTELNESLDDTNLITQIIPVGRERLMLPELSVNSEYINSYEEVYTREIAFSDIGIDEDNNIDEEHAHELLRSAANKYFRETECDKVKANYSISIKDIKNNPKYKECSFFYKLDIGDYVTVLKSNGLKIKVRLLEYEYDSLKEEFIKLSLNGLNKKLTTKSAGIENSIKSILNNNGSVNSEKLEGLINMLQVNMGAMVDVAEKHKSKAILFEDRVQNSETYGALAIGTKGFMIASEFDAIKDDWNWRTFGTGQGFVADCIVTGVLSAIIIQSVSGNLKIDLSSDNGILFKRAGIGALQINGGNVTFKSKDGLVDISTLKSDEYFSQMQNKNIFATIFEFISNFSIVCKDITDFSNNPLHLFEYLQFGRGDVYTGIKAPDSLLIAAGASPESSDSLMTIQTRHSEGEGGYRSTSISISKDNIQHGHNGCNNLILGNLINKFGTATIEGDFRVYGSKNCIQKSTEYGDIRFYATEDINSLLTKTPINELLETTLNLEGEYTCIVKINQLIRECINTDLDYNIWITKLGKGDIWVKNTYPGYFIIQSSEPIKFKYKLEGVRKGFEDCNEKKYYLRKLEG